VANENAEPTGAPPRLVASERDLEEIARACAAAERVGVDVESNGMFVYRARVCTVQLAWDDNIAIVDALATPLAALGPMLAAERPIKIVHDVAFDARILAEAGLPLAGVHDTAIAARMIGRMQTGLASLLASELGLTIGKEMQQHDWSIRPLDARGLSYLATDVRWLAALDDKIFGEAGARGVMDEVLCETRYRTAGAIASAREGDPRPPYVRVKGGDKLAPLEMSVLREIAEVREREAEARDVPPHRVMSADALLEIARARPTDVRALSRLRGVPGAIRGELARGMLRAIEDGAARAAVPADEQERFLTKRRLPPAESKARREREARLSAWRKQEAARRGVDEQAVLPGHCLKEIADGAPATLEELTRIDGFGDFRVARDGAAILGALAEQKTEASE
jgi:ribonuclease D